MVQVLFRLKNPCTSNSSHADHVVPEIPESKEKIVANLANFAYDPYNYTFLRQLNVLELFLDCITEPNEKLVEFGIGGICNSCVDPANASIVTQCGGIPLIIQCLSSPVRNTVNYAIGALYYLCNASNKGDILKPEVVDVIRSCEFQRVTVACSRSKNRRNADLVEDPLITIQTPL
ncbi:uncharacterized protein LOC130776236 isoform X3 [Actinidia eriantha]|uniref:uncharacterized protein LOC130776236 isoform X3 n=1 Tax=Actinidia eriantha TaxID=165200 RepID=UPI00258AA62A|nr:uncharacterized protein LOC130776236 isoform X3 [Actinidia eriantha]